MTTDRLRPTQLEIAAGVMPGEDPQGALLPDLDPASSPLAVLERAVLPALARPPCLVTFSGGRDSSAVLAATVRSARREGLPLPVPLTERYPGIPGADESGWQELVIRHLRLDDWERRTVAEDELDFVGPCAAAGLRRHGLLWPANVFSMAPMLEGARGGSLLTGLGGDDVMGYWRWTRIADVLARRARPRPRDVLRLGHALGPRRIRRARARGSATDLPWLRPSPQEVMGIALAAEVADEPLRWDRRVPWSARRRQLAAAVWSTARLAADADVLVAHPLIDPHFLAALARSGGRTGFGDRTGVMEAVFSDVLPREVLARADKAQFEDVFWGAHSRSFIASWTGEGVDPKLVDDIALREAWERKPRDFRTALLLQSAWLGSSAELSHQAVGHGPRARPPAGAA